ncbi:hypothetical protein GCM10022397_18650 [Flavivirga jejuensis]
MFLLFRINLKKKPKKRLNSKLKPNNSDQNKEFYFSKFKKLNLSEILYGIQNDIF